MQVSIKPHFLSILAAIAFAMQHPFTKIGSGGHYSVLFLAVWTNLFAAILFIIFLMLVYGVKIQNMIDFLSNKRYVYGILLYAALGVASSLIYMWTISFTNIVIFSLILNSSPLWGALWGKLISARKLPSFFVFTVLFYIFILISSAWLFEPRESIYQISYWSLTALLIPCIFVYRSAYINSLFWGGNEHELKIGAALGSIIASILLSIFWLILIALGTEKIPTQIEMQLLPVTFGSACVIAGTVLYQHAIKNSGNNIALITSYNMLIPSFVTLISLFFNEVLNITNLVVQRHEILSAIIILLIMSLFIFKNLKPQL